MKSLKEFLFNNTENIIDCHFHAFGCFGSIKPKNDALLMVDNPTYDNEPLLKYFDKYSDLLQNNKFLVIGKDYDETIDILNKYPNCLGVGEVKVYKKHEPSTKPGVICEHFDLDFLEKLVKTDINKPIFIHYDLKDDNVEWLDNILDSRKTIVLCHCGINKLFNQDRAFELARHLQQKHSNLFLDVSWVALDYFLQNKDKLANLDNCRLLYGSDNNRLSQEHYDDMVKISKYINNKANLEMLKELSKKQ
jgi:hypoxanthine phosphoribosyltransferase